MNIFLINIAVTKYLYGLASTNIWTEYISIFLSDGIFVIGFCVYVLVMLPLRKKGIYTRTVFHDIAPAITTGVAAFVTKYFITANRPFIELGFSPFVPQPDPYSSYSSFHSAVFAAFASTLVFHHRKLGIFLLSLLPLLMIGRIAIGVHWLTDVLIGTLLGLSISFRYYFKFHKSGKIAEKLVNRYLSKNKKAG